MNKSPFLITRTSILSNPFYIIRRGLFEAIKQLSGQVAGEILDFGCGSKPYEALFTRATTYLGVDLEVSGHSHEDSKIDVFYDGTNLPFQDESFDGVVCFEVFEHVFNLNEVLSEIRRVLREDGVLLVSAPFAWDEHEIPYDFARYTSFGLTYLLEQHGFEILEYKKTTTTVLAIGQLWISYLYQYMSPKNRTLRKIFKAVVIFPGLLIVLGLNWLFPKKYDYFCNSVVLCKKTKLKVSGSAK